MIPRTMDLEGASYPVTAEQLKGAKFFLVADPFSLSRRAVQLESVLTGEDHLARVAKPSELAEQLKAAGVEVRSLFGTFRSVRWLASSR